MAQDKTADSAADPPDQEETRRLQDDMNALRRDFARLTETLRDMAAARRDEGLSAAQDAADHAARQAQAAKAQAERTITENPLLSVAIALGAGYILGRLMGDR